MDALFRGFGVSRRVAFAFVFELLLCSAGVRGRAQVTPVGASVHARGTMQFAGVMNGRPVANGYWYVNGTGDPGYMDPAGVYHAPFMAPTPNVVTVGYYDGGLNISVPVTVTNPVPLIHGLNVSSIYETSTPVVITGDGFVPGATVLVNGKTVPSTYVQQDQINFTLVLSKSTTGNVAITVQNPAPGASSVTIQVPAAFSTTHVLPASAAVHAGGTQQYTVTVNGAPPNGGYWYSNGGGWIEPSGLFHAPSGALASNAVTIGYFLNGATITTTASVTNPVPVPNLVNVSEITQVTTSLALHGTGFLPTSVVYAQGVAMPTTLSNGWLFATVTLAHPETGTVKLVVQNPGPGASSGSISVPASFPVMSGIKPAAVASGWQNFTITGSGFTSSTIATMDGRPMQTTVNGSTSLTAVGYLPPWNTSPTTTVAILPEAGSEITGSRSLKVTYPAVSYDAAARFTTQAAFGPRPAVVDWIQQHGLQAFLTEQFQQPALTYPSNVLPRYWLMAQVTEGGSMLRQRVAMALSSFIDNQALTEEFQSYAPWEQTLETDAFGNFRQLMTDMVSNPRFADFLNLPGDVAEVNGVSHPNPNVPRELLHLFTIGTSMLNDDGSVQTDASGRPIPSYDQNTVLDMSRAFTGWNFGPLTNPAYTAFNIDWSQPLVAQNQYHDMGAKTLFGTVQLPAGQDAATDRQQALDAIFNHQNVPPFLATRLINQLVKSNPTPAYVKRISTVFENDGKGVRGNLQAVVQAILMDPEARAGDATDVAPTDGFVQDPLLWECFLLSSLEQTNFDGQLIYFPGQLSQDWFHPVSVFAFYPPQFLLPGTTVNSPQFALLNNLTQQHRSQLTYGIVSGTVNGFGAAYQANSWLYTAFTNLPDLVTALNHQLYHGQMPAAVQSAIMTYCSGIANRTQQFDAAIFLALNSDSYNVSH